MPVLRGSAKKAWLERMANQSGTDSPYRWSEVQGKSRSQEGQMRVLGYTLGRPEALTPWLEALKECGARIRGVYAPVMLATKVLQGLKVKIPSSDESISVLVTPHESGLRQTVLVGNRVRFSRLALSSQIEGAHWFEAVIQETGRLREYLISNGLLKSDNVGMQVHAVLPLSSQGLSDAADHYRHPKDHYEWLSTDLPHLLYVQALAKRQALDQLAPQRYRKHDLTMQATHALQMGMAFLVLVALGYCLVAGNALWEKQSQITSAKEQANQASLQYQTIAKTFPNSPLTSTQLLDMAKKWRTVEAEQPPNMRDMLSIVGQTLERHPSLRIDELTWQIESSPAAPDPASVNNTAVKIENKKPPPITASLVIRGAVRGVSSDDLRGTRDLLGKLEDDFKRQPTLRLEVTQRPLDLSSKASLTGSGVQDRAELSFEIKLWQL